MYTQCPECHVAFRVTADVLRQAAGKVRCGGCGVAFNALDYLSEVKPQSRMQTEPEPRLPELEPEPRDDSADDDRLQSISAEQSAALLKTLDQLAGEDIRIEDTGIEWRVLDLEEPADDSGDITDEHIALTDTESSKFVLSDAVEDSTADVHERTIAASYASSGDTAADEMRFDDNTPLPDDFGLDSQSAVVSTAGDLIAEVATPPSAPDESQEDVALGDPDEWQDLLGEVDAGHAPRYEPTDAKAQDTPPVEELAADVREPDPDEPPDVDTQFALQAEAMGVDLSGVHMTVDTGPEPAIEDEDAAAQTSIDDDLIAAAFESEAIARAEATPAESLLENIADDAVAENLGEGPDIEESAAAVLEEEPPAPGPLEHGGSEAEHGPVEAMAAEPDDFQLDPEAIEAAAVEAAEAEEDAFEEYPETVEAAETEAEEDAREEYPETVEAAEAEADEFGEGQAPIAAAEAAADEVEEDSEPADVAAAAADEFENDPEAIETVEAEADAFEEDPEPVQAADAEPDEYETQYEILADREAEVFAMESEPAQASADESPDIAAWLEGEDEQDAGELASVETEAHETASEGAVHAVPEMTEEEMTINMMIDQELLAIAVEDEDGFASTIGQKQPLSADEIADKKAKAKKSPQVEKNVPLVETIIMEGETIRGTLDIEKEVEKAGFMAQARNAVSKQFPDHEDEKRSVSPGVIIGVVLLVGLLATQAVHQLRESLVTIPAFSQSIGPIYRSIGKPVTPAWDVSGWRFEATKGSTDDGNEFLTIYSRIGNTSEEALPYPLVHVSLTDRFEEIIGSRVLEPAEYLVGDTDPREAVAPGNTFNAVISIETPAPDATGFKLNVCYRMASGQLRCAIEDFR